MTSVAVRPSAQRSSMATTPPPRPSSSRTPSSDDDIAGRLLASALCTPPVAAISKHAPGSTWTPPSSSRTPQRSATTPTAQLQSPSPLSPERRRRNPPHPRQPAATFRPVSMAPRRSTAPASPSQAGAPSTSTSLEHAGATPPARGPPARRAPFGILSNAPRAPTLDDVEFSAKRLDFDVAANPWAINSSVGTSDVPASATQSPKRKPHTENFSGSSLEMRKRDGKDARMSAASDPDEVTRETSKQGKEVRAMLGMGLAPAFETEDSNESAALRRGPAPAPKAARSAPSTRRRVGGTMLRQAPAPGSLRRTGSPKTPPAPLPLATHAAGMAGLGLGIAGVESMEASVAAPSPPEELESPGSSTSSVPSIIITPPAVIGAQAMTRSASDLLVPQARPYAGVVLSFSDPAASLCGLDLAQTNAQLVCEQGDASQRSDSSMTSFSPLAWFSPAEGCDKTAGLIQFPTPPTSPSLRAQGMRQLDDAAAFDVLAARLDNMLSSFFYCYSASQSHLLCREFVAEIRNALVPYTVKVTTSEPQMPSLVRARWVGEGDAREWIAAEWCAKWHAQAVEQIMEHVITGVMALLADTRAPDGTSESMARLCLYLRNELRSLDEAPEYSFRPASPSELYTNGLAASPVLSGERDPPPHMDLEARRHSDLPYIDTPDFWAPDQADEPVDLAQPATVFTALLNRTLDALLERGAAVRERANHLTVPPLRRGSKKRFAAATAHADAARRARDSNLKLATKGEISEDEFRSRERQQAAVGSKKDSFADIETVRFLGELYRYAMLDIAVVQDWLDRLLFETVFPGVPSAYELEAGCALLLTVGSTLETASFNEARGASPTGRRSSAGSTCSSPESDSPRTPPRECREEQAHSSSKLAQAFSGVSGGAVVLANKAPANHWINHSPETTLRGHARRSSVWRATASPSASDSGSDSPGSLASPPLAPPNGSAQATLDATMLRLREVLDIPEISRATKDWCREVIAFSARGWRKPISIKLKSPPRIAERSQPRVSLA